MFVLFTSKLGCMYWDLSCTNIIEQVVEMHNGWITKDSSGICEKIHVFFKKLKGASEVQAHKVKTCDMWP